MRKLRGIAMSLQRRRRQMRQPRRTTASALEALERRALLSAAAAPVLVTDLNLATADASPSWFFAGSGTTLFSASDGVTGTELWRTDGTPGRTRLVKDINPGAASSVEAGFTSSAPLTFGALPGGVTVFVADDGVHGLELWRTDGTEPGTQLVKDINP